jgi:hypothetical protein
LHDALVAQEAAARLAALARSAACAPSEISADGKTIDTLMVFELMRKRGYQVDTPVRPQTQLKHGMTTWLVHVTLPSGESFTLVFYEPIKPESTKRK